MNRRDKSRAPSLVATLHGVIETVTSSLPLEAVLDAIVGEACSSLGGAASALYQVDPGTDNLRVIAAQHLDPSYVADALVPIQSGAPIGIAVAEGRTVVVPDIHDPKGVENLPALIEDGLHEGLRPFGALVAAPLRSNAEVLGGLVVYYTSPRAFDDDEVRLVELFARQAALILDNAALHEQVRIYQALQELLLSLSAISDLSVILNTGLARLGQLSGSHSAAILVPTAERDRLRLVAGYNFRDEILAELQSHSWRIEPESRLAAVRAFLTGRPALIEDITPVIEQSGLLSRIAAKEGFYSVASLPIDGHSGRLGVLNLYFNRPRRFRSDEVGLYQSFAAIVGLIVETSQLVRQTQRLAASEERARLARELHDSITQSLFSMTLTAKAARRALLTDPGATDTLLGELQTLAQASLSEMRALIFELRPAALEREGLVAALRKRADATAARTGLTVEIVAEGDERLSPEQEEAFYYIAREALHNASRHAGASEATVRLQFEADQVRLEIQDNGTGFDPDQRCGGLGLLTMRERAAQLGADLEVRTASGHGTTVRVSLPRGGAGSARPAPSSREE